MKISLEEFKGYIQEEVGKVELEGLQEQLGNIREKLNVVEYLYKMKMLGEGITNKTDTVNDTNRVSEDSDNKVDLGKDEEQLGDNEYYFKKKIMGGMLLNLPESFIAETVIRNMGLESGDLVRVEDTEDVMNTMTLIKKGAKYIPDTEFDIFPFATVKKEDGYYYCDEYYDDGIKVLKIDGTPYKFLLNQGIIDKYRVEEGDMLDLGIAKDSPTYIKVIWRHHRDKHLVPKPSSTYKEKASKQQPKDKFPGISLNNKKILVMGCEPRKTVFENAITDCDGVFSFLDGDENDDRVKPAIDNADVVLILRDFLSHPFVKKAIKHAKSKGKPFSAPDGLGVSNLIEEANKLVMQLRGREYV